MLFIFENSMLRQKIYDSVDFNIEMIERGGCLDEVIMILFVWRFDLVKVLLFRIGLMEFEENCYMFLFDMYYLIFDGVFIGIILEELVWIYKGEQFFEFCFQYKDYVVW